MEFTSQSKRLPIYLLVDVSGSMAGAPITAVNDGLQVFETTLKGDPMAMETAYVSVISFESDARQVIPLSSVTSFTAPTLMAGGATSLGKALELLGKAIDSEIVEKSHESPGDCKPLVFLLTDGEPTDDWQGPLATLKNRLNRKPASIFAIGCGPNVNKSVLHQITESVMLMADVTSDQIKALFQWISQSAKVASRTASQVSTEAGSSMNVQLPPPPGGFVISL